MTYYDKLVALWPQAQGADTAAKLAWVNAKTVKAETSANIPVKDLVATFDPAELTTLTVAQLLTIQILLASQITVDVSKGTRLRAQLVGLFSAKPNTMAALTALAAKYDAADVAWWKANDYPREFQLGDIEAAGLS